MQTIHTDICTKTLLDLAHSMAAPLLEQYTYPWEALPKIGQFIAQLGPRLSEQDYLSPRPGVWIHKTAKVAPSAHIGDQVIIGAGTEVRHCAFIRGNALVGEGAVVGNSTELKNVILFDRVQVPHFNYVGDSILGFRSHMGAGAITSNVKSDCSLTTVRLRELRIETGLKKFGAILGDYVEVGCNTVLNPATIVGSHTNIYPLSLVRGYIPGNSIYKHHGEIVTKRP